MKNKFPFEVSKHAFDRYQERVVKDKARYERNYAGIKDIILYSLFNSPFFDRNNSVQTHYLINMRGIGNQEEYGCFYLFVGQNEETKNREVVTIYPPFMLPNLPDDCKRKHPRGRKDRRKYASRYKPKELESFLRD